MGLGTLLLRLVVGGAFAAHGLQKLRGWFGGGGIDGTEKAMAATRMYPTRRNAYLVALAETGGGLALAAGAATPAATAALTATMVTAVRKVHWSNGFFNSDRGWEFNAVLTAAAAAVTAEGPGPLSIDAALGRRRWGAGWAIAALALGVAGSVGAVLLGERSAPSPEHDPSGERD
jgi:putative oxidoreductase